MGDVAGVEVDTTELVADVAALARGIDGVANRAPAAAANRVATRLRSSLPRRSGRLANSVHVVDVSDGAGVSYGAGVPYARYIDHRTNAVDESTAGAATAYAADCERQTAAEVARL